MRAENQRGESRPELFAAIPAPSANDIAAAAAQLRTALEPDLSLKRVAASLAQALRRVCFGSSVAHAIAEHLGWSYDSSYVSMSTAYWRFAEKEALESFARSLGPRRGTIGFVMAGNVPGAGLHELIAALLARCAVMVKTATSEPIFFAAFAAMLCEIDPELGARIAVFNWPRERGDLSAAMRASCDAFVAFGDDGTIARLRSPLESGIAAPFSGFGARVSGIVLAEGTLDKATIYEAAMDVVRFEQRGCLSPHHIFIRDPENARAADVAARLVEELQRISRAIPPARRLSLEDAAAIRRAREIARWRSIGGHHVRLWESAHLDWTVIYDRDATFTSSPGFRTLYLSPFRDAADLECRLEPVRGKLEAFAIKSAQPGDLPEHIAEVRRVLERLGVTYICEPGRMQSPPLDWPHGGGAFLRLLRDDK